MIVYFSNVSGYTETFIRKLGVPAQRIPLKTSDAKHFTVNNDFVLVTPTYGEGGRGSVPKQVIQFLNQETNRQFIRGVIASGNRNFLEDFAKAGDIIAEKCSVPVLYRFELAGTPEDVITVREGLKKFWQTRDV